jgi:protein-tyrosine-phosphatase
MKRIVFVCVENSCRSQIAEAFARIHNPGEVEVYSSGSRPSGTVNEKAIASMAEVNYDLTKHTSKSLNEIPDIAYDAVITMGCGDECPSLRAVRREDWGVPDPKHLPMEEFRAVRDLIEAKVKTLLRELSGSTSS